jgi:hypothetical protein
MVFYFSSQRAKPEKLLKAVLIYLCELFKINTENLAFGSFSSSLYIVDD